MRAANIYFNKGEWKQVRDLIEASRCALEEDEFTREDRLDLLPGVRDFLAASETDEGSALIGINAEGADFLLEAMDSMSGVVAQKVEDMVGGGHGKTTRARNTEIRRQHYRLGQIAQARDIVRAYRNEEDEVRGSGPRAGKAEAASVG